MIRLLNKIPRTKLYLACSGGADSMSALSFLRSGGHDVEVLHFDHGTEFGTKARKFLQDFCKDNDIIINIGTIQAPKLSSQSWEEYWRDERYKFFSQYSAPIVMVHNLNDQMEQWIFTSMHGNPRLIPYRRNNIIRPFILNLKDELVSWCIKKQVPWIEDPSNEDCKYARNQIRHKILPEALKINPGLAKVIKKKIIEEMNENG